MNTKKKSESQKVKEDLIYLYKEINNLKQMINTMTEGLIGEKASYICMVNENFISMKTYYEDQILELKEQIWELKEKLKETK